MVRTGCLSLLMLLAACTTSGGSASVAPSPRPTPGPTPQLTAAAPTPTPEPTQPATAAKQPGETLTVTQGETDLLAITVSQVKFVTAYADTQFGCCPDQPAAGNVYVEMFVEYEALDSGTSFGSFDWQIYGGDIQIADYPAFVSNGPKPELTSGDLPAGRKASGWMVYEVPTAGRITLAYLPYFASNTEPVGEYLLRES